MSLSVMTNIIFGIDIRAEITKEEVASLEEKGLTVSPVTYRNDEETNRYVIGVLVDSIRDIGDASAINFSHINQEQAKTTILEALKQNRIPLTHNYKIAMYVNNFYY